MKKQRKISSLQEARIQNLARSGFSYRTMTQRVFGDESDATKLLVARVLRRADLRLKDYRDGKSKFSRGLITECLRIKKPVLTGTMRVRKAVAV